MGIYYPVDFIADLLDIISRHACFNTATHTLDQAYMKPNVQADLVEVNEEDIEQWRDVMKATVGILKDTHPKDFERLRKWHPEVMGHVGRLMKAEQKDIDILLRTPLQSLPTTSTLSLASLPVRAIYSTRADTLNAIDWLNNIAYPKYIIYQTFCAKYPRMTFINFLDLHRYLKEEVDEILLRREVLESVLETKLGGLWGGDERAELAVEVAEFRPTDIPLPASPEKSASDDHDHEPDATSPSALSFTLVSTSVSDSTLK